MRLNSWLFGAAFCCLFGVTATAAERPNVILIMTDDQGYGDLGVHGNPIVRTPHLDAMAARSAVLKNFYVSPVCTPTRACLLTGRYNYRTRAIDTNRGRAMMDPDEVTIAEILKRAGYATGIFGKWHLGDCWPMRAMDQGFEETLVHRGGGIGQPSDPPGGEGKYTDPILFRNGKAAPMKGYCTDVYFREGMKWADTALAGKRPFFLYLPTNAPHGPLNDVPRDKYDYYRTQHITADRLPKTPGHPIAKGLDADTQARVYAMIENIDDNVGRLFAWLDRGGLTDNTVVLFLTDNGRATAGYNAGFRGLKSDVYEGGIRSPLFAHWPGQLKPGVASDHIAAHVDLLPTLLEVCGVDERKDLKLDGRSLWPLLKRQAGPWPERTLFTQSHRGDLPMKYHHFAVRTQKWKLVRNSGFGLEKPPPGRMKLELFDMASDPFEMKNVAEANPDVVADLRGQYEAWFEDVSHTRPGNFAPPRIRLDPPHQEPVVLTQQDWRGANWGPNDRGYWDVESAAPATYEIRLIFASPVRRAVLQATMEGTTRKLEKQSETASKTFSFANLHLPAGVGRVQGLGDRDKTATPVRFVEIRKQR